MVGSFILDHATYTVCACVGVREHLKVCHGIILNRKPIDFMLSGVFALACDVVPP